MQQILKDYGRCYQPARSSFIEAGLINIFAGVFFIAARFVNVVLNITSTVFGFVFTPIESLSRRLGTESGIPGIEWLGAICEDLAWVAKKGFGIPWLIEKILVAPLAGMGNALFTFSGEFTVMPVVGNGDRTVSCTDSRDPDGDPLLFDTEVEGREQEISTEPKSDSYSTLLAKFDSSVTSDNLLLVEEELPSETSISDEKEMGTPCFIPVDEGIKAEVSSGSAFPIYNGADDHIDNPPNILPTASCCS